MTEALAAAEAPAPELNPDADLSEIWQRNNTPEPEPAPEAVEPEPAPAPQVDIPSDVPKALKDRWASLDAEVRDAVLTSHRELSGKLGEQGRMVQGIAPIRDVLVKAVNDLPALKNMKPDQVAEQVFELAKVSAQFTQNPIDTIIGLAEKHNIMDALREKLGGGEVTQNTRVNHQLMQELSRLQQEVQKLRNPEHLQEQFEQLMQVNTAQQELQNFAAKAEHWGTVEPYMPQAIQFARAKLGESASAKDVLTQAYDLAVSQFVPEANRASDEAAAEAAKLDPAKAEAARKAKSVNVTGKQTGEAREPTEDEALRAAYRRAQNQ